MCQRKDEEDQLARSLPLMSRSNVVGGGIRTNVQVGRWF